MSFLTDILPPKVREVLYALYAVLTLVAGSLDVAFGDADPVWLSTGIKVLLYVGGALGLTAAANTPALVEAKATTKPFTQPL